MTTTTDSVTFFGEAIRPGSVIVVEHHSVTYSERSSNGVWRNTLGLRKKVPTRRPVSLQQPQRSRAPSYGSRINGSRSRIYLA